MLERKLVLDPGSWVLRLLDCRSRHLETLRSCIYKDKEVEEFGEEALQAYWERGKSRIVYPMAQGKIVKDIRGLLEAATHQAGVSSRLFKPRVLVILPQDVLEEQKDAWVRLCLQAGFGKVEFASSMDLLKTDTGLVIHTGASCTEMAIFCNGQQIRYKKIIHAGSQMDEKIMDQIARQFRGLAFSEDAARLKELASQAFWQNRNPRFDCTILDYTSHYIRIGLPAASLWPAMEAVLEQIVLWAQDMISQCSPAIMDSLLENPVHLSGGLAQCYGLKQMLETRLDMQVLIREDPQNWLVWKGARFKGAR